MIDTILQLITQASKNLSSDVYAVGGFVRDQYLGIPMKTDIDFVVIGSGIEFGTEVVKLCSTECSLIVFEPFDTSRVVFLCEKREKIIFEVEFAGARIEQYDSHSRKPIVQSTSLLEDLKRRDFTVNAMARQVIEGKLSEEIIDPYDGRSDIEKKILRTPLDPDDTFFDDPLRTLRAARFASQLGFEIEQNTFDALIRNKERLAIISKERIWQEFSKLLSTKTPSVGLWILYHTQLFEKFLPEVCELSGVEEVKGYTHKDNLSHTFAVVDNIAEYSDKMLLRFAGLLHDIAKPDTKKFIKGRGWTFDMHEHLGKKMAWVIGTRLRMKKSDIRYVAKLVRWHLQPIALMDEGVTDSPVRRLIVNLKDDLEDLLILCRADVTTGNQYKRMKRMKNYDKLEERIKEVLEKDKLRAFQSPVRGEEIMQLCGLKGGPTVGKIKDEIERAILDGEISNDYELAKEYFLRIKDRYIEEAEVWERV